MYLSNDVMIHPQGDPDPVNTLPSSVSGDQRWLWLRYRDIDCWLSHPAPAIAGHEPHICQDELTPGHWMLCVHFVELNKYTAISNISKSCETREKLWKFCERLDLLVKKMVRGRFADIWEDLMGFLENRPSSLSLFFCALSDCISLIYRGFNNTSFFSHFKKAVFD